jgi:hypothetical protein
MDPLSVSLALKYYKRRDVQEAIVRHAAQREVAPRYGEGFGKRPDVLEHPQDVLEFATRRMTSLHGSEERWENPLHIVTGMSRKEASALRAGWDLVLDIDAKDWEISRLIAHLFVLALREHGVSPSAKFSGNKGWHVGVPWEAFPPAVLDAKGQDVPTKDLFPELPRAIAKYLAEYIGELGQDRLVRVTKDGAALLLGRKPSVRIGIDDLARKAGKRREQLFEESCPTCKKAITTSGEEYALICTNASCQHRTDRKHTREERDTVTERELACPKCGRARDFELVSREGCPHQRARGFVPHRRLKLTEVIEFDTILLASRHLYRMPYSLHEKSGLASVVVDPGTILSFRKEFAAPESADLARTFLDASGTVPGEAATLVVRAWTMAPDAPAAGVAHQREFEVAENAIPEEHFPPCMKRILEGLPDGKKRAMFALTNFLQVCGWAPEMIEKRLHEWNEKNPEPLREVVIKGHCRSHLGKKIPILPPNCMQFYRELNVCFPDDLCRTIRNPAQYATKKAKMGKRGRRRSGPAE